MRKTLISLAALGLVAFAAMTFQPVEAQAGNLTASIQGQGGGRPQKDATNGQEVLESYDRGISWRLPVAYSALSGTSGVPLSITMTGVSVSSGVPTTYKGPWFVKLFNTVSTVAAISLTYSAAYNADLSPYGKQATTGLNGELILGPLAPSDFAHIRGLTATAIGAYQLGTYDR